jgi:hypothetical protein
MKRKGFTLVEGLVLVGVLGILALLATPVFIDAQVRAKVASVVSEMSAVATALEEYTLDHGDYPPGLAPMYYNQVGFPPHFAAWMLTIRLVDGTEWVGAGWYLTTPVAYLDSIPMDPWFHLGNPLASIDVERLSYFYRRGWGEGWEMLPQITVSILYSDYQYKNPWYLQSPGPNTLAWDHDPRVFYDPTNGIVSQGDIVWFQKEGLRGGGIEEHF